MRITGYWRIALWFLVYTCTCTVVQAAEPEETPEVIVVTGRLPGPPLWRVTNGENVLWIFAYLNPVPKDMQWESQRVEDIIARSQVYLPLPDVKMSISPVVMFNPFNIVRGMRLVKRLNRNPDDKSLREVLPPSLYRRYAALKERYFPDDREIEELRPMQAAGRMRGVVFARVGLGSAENSILKTLERHARRNRDLERVDTEEKVEIDGGYRKLAERWETMMNSLSPEQEQACFESQLDILDVELEALKSSANSWAQGHVDELREVYTAPIDADPCFQLLQTSSENSTLADIMQRSRQRWLAAADAALAGEKTTFAVLNVNELVSENGLLASLKARGYQVREPQ